MMQSYASAAKLRGGGPILNRGSKTMSNIGLSPPRIVICSSASIRERTAEPQLCLPTVKLFTSPGEGADLRALARPTTIRGPAPANPHHGPAGLWMRPDTPGRVRLQIGADVPSHSRPL